MLKRYLLFLQSNEKLQKLFKSIFSKKEIIYRFQKFVFELSEAENLRQATGRVAWRLAVPEAEIQVHTRQTEERSLP